MLPILEGFTLALQDWGDQGDNSPKNIAAIPSFPLSLPLTATWKNGPCNGKTYIMRNHKSHLRPPKANSKRNFIDKFSPDPWGADFHGISYHPVNLLFRASMFSHVSTYTFVQPVALWELGTLFTLHTKSIVSNNNVSYTISGLFTCSPSIGVPGPSDQPAEDGGNVLGVHREEAGNKCKSIWLLYDEKFYESQVLSWLKLKKKSSCRTVHYSQFSLVV